VDNQAQSDYVAGEVHGAFLHPGEFAAKIEGHNLTGIMPDERTERDTAKATRFIACMLTKKR
jgi:hypothetical protein